MLRYVLSTFIDICRLTIYVVVAMGSKQANLDEFMNSLNSRNLQAVTHLCETIPKETAEYENAWEALAVLQTLQSLTADVS
jgi:hypothetical protein